MWPVFLISIQRHFKLLNNFKRQSLCYLLTPLYNEHIKLKNHSRLKMQLAATGQCNMCVHDSACVCKWLWQKLFQLLLSPTFLHHIFSPLIFCRYSVKFKIVPLLLFPLLLFTLSHHGPWMQYGQYQNNKPAGVFIPRLHQGRRM